ncbi:hypothetical protein EYF80_052938 [Liparis tanakae]|uniref:Uncharacterized protein n=1 Tax=Liparis tanakae TaxID=230148 RepID=A0A4Z2F6M3_9TELE|nr:hypothetical protein EYF80_052938 [Liparis tanakae]
MLSCNTTTGLQKNDGAGSRRATRDPGDPGDLRYAGPLITSRVPTACLRARLGSSSTWIGATAALRVTWTGSRFPATESGFGPTRSSRFGGWRYLGDGYFGALVDELHHVVGVALVRRHEEALGEREDLSRVPLAHGSGGRRRRGTRGSGRRLLRGIRLTHGERRTQAELGRLPELLLLPLD